MKQTYLQEIAWNDQGLMPAIAQDARTGRILMMAWMNAESLTLTVSEGVAVYWSRSRNRLWRKGETSGHTQKVVEIQLDCDGDALLLKVEQQGGIACHTGRESCFYRTLRGTDWHTTEDVLRDPNDIYR